MHFINTKDLSKEDITILFKLASELKIKTEETLLKDKTIALLFFENSTRTRCSFELAAKRLGATILNLDLETSSQIKGEDLIDTFKTLEAMKVDAFVIRHSNNDICQKIVARLKSSTTLINAGTGTLEHPSQALLDAFTIFQNKTSFEKLSIAIVGDIKHSRVAHSNITLLKTLGVRDIRLVGPEKFLPKEEQDITCFTDLISGIKNVDIIMTLRIQKERMADSEIPNTKTYFDVYGLTKEKLRFAKPHAIVMHPGPMNREIEIASDVADSNQSMILKQVENGVYMRQAILKWLLI